MADVEGMLLGGVGATRPQTHGNTDLHGLQTIATPCNSTLYERHQAVQTPSGKPFRTLCSSKWAFQGAIVANKLVENADGAPRPHPLGANPLQHPLYRAP